MFRRGCSAFRIIYFLLVLIVFTSGNTHGQNETAKWYFGTQAGLDFMTTPPTILTNGAMTAPEGCASIADAAGNLLFYTEGVTVYNSQHAVMGNGTGLFGGNSPCQAVIIIRQPGSTTLYYVFTMQGISGNMGLNYSVVDMSLAAGLGSVTVKNAPLHNGPCYEKITATKHCNGIDYWVLVHEIGTSNFRAYLLTSSGVSTTAVISAIGSAIGMPYSLGCMKISPSGRKLGMTEYTGAVDLFDFDNSTGVVSNSLALAPGFSSYGCEFSPDGTKFYAGGFGGHLKQWDLCAGSNTAIIASHYSVTTSGIWSMQLAKDGKIYCAKSPSLGVINSPNLAGSLCNYVDLGQSISPKSTGRSIPNFIGSNFSAPPPAPPFTYSVNNAYGCQTASFSAPPSVSTITNIGCSSVGYSMTGLQWNFGDPASGSANTSTLTNPLHAFPTLGTYTVQLIRYFTCGAANDTIKQVVIINQPCITVNSTSITCANLGSATVAATGGIGPYSYTWMPTAQSGSVATGLSPGTYTLTVFDFGNNFTYTANTTFNSLVPLTGNIFVTPTVSCFGASTGTGQVSNLAGGSGTQLYSWFNGVTTLTTQATSSLSAGIWSVTVTDALTGCTIKQSVLITQPPPMGLLATATTPSVCAGTSASFSAVNSGGTPFLTGSPYSYSWTNGPAGETFSPLQSSGGTFVYTVTSRDSLNCAISQTVMINVINNPPVSVNQVSICPLKSGTLIATGATSYTWNSLSTGSTLVDSPLQATVYTVTGSALGCTASATGTIFLHVPPVPVFQSNSPVCNAQSLQLSGGGGVSYLWSGPLGFSSGLVSPVLNPANPLQSGVYTVTVTSAQGCTASTSGSVVVNPTPTLSAQGSTVCTTGTLTLNSQSVPNATFTWKGPSFNSTVQNPILALPPLSQNGFYTVVATSAQGCTNAAVAHVSVTAPPTLLLSSNGPKCEGSIVQFSCNGGETFLWSGPLAFSSNQQAPQISSAPSAASGVYTNVITWGPCSVSATINLVVFPLPLVSAGSNGNVCESKQILLTGSTAHTVISHQWKGPANFNSTSAGAFRNNSILAHSGVYTLSVTDKNGCSHSGTTLVTVMPNPDVAASGATVCLYQSAVVSASGATSYFWQGPGFFQFSGQSATIVSVGPVQAGSYTVTGTAANGCTTATFAYVDKLELPAPAIQVFPKDEVCENDEVTLTGNGGVNYTWTGPLNFNRSGETVTFKPLAISSGIYTLVAANAIGCKNSSTVKLMVRGLPSGELSGTFAGCDPFCSTFLFKPLTLGVSATWDLGGVVATEESFHHCLYGAGTYTLKGFLVDGKTGCENTVQKTVTVHSKPQASFKVMPEVPVENRDEVEFVSTTEGAAQKSWLWYFGSADGLSSANISGERVSTVFEAFGIVPVALVVQNEWGCVDTVVKHLTIAEEVNLFVPNAFTPNADGENDQFKAVGSGIRSFAMRVYDRWGEEVFHAKDLTTGWDGTFKGVGCVPAVYTYLIETTSKGGIHKITNGHVTLVR